jgi:hypothetical protein
MRLRNGFVDSGKMIFRQSDYNALLSKPRSRRHYFKYYADGLMDLRALFIRLSALLLLVKKDDSVANWQQATHALCSLICLLSKLSFWKNLPSCSRRGLF